MKRLSLTLVFLFGCVGEMNDPNAPNKPAAQKEELTPYRVALEQMADVTVEIPIVITSRMDGVTAMVMYDTPQLKSDKPMDTGFKSVVLARGVPTSVLIPTTYACSRVVEDISLMYIDSSVFNPYDRATADQFDDTFRKFVRVGGVDVKLIPPARKDNTVALIPLQGLLATFYINDVDVGVLPKAKHMGSLPNLGNIAPRKNLGSDQWDTLFIPREFLPCP